MTNTSNALLSGLVDAGRQTTTRNGMPATNSTKNPFVDFFYSVPSQRNSDMKKKYALYSQAHIENPTNALRLLFWLRDARGGSGERNTFQGIINLAAVNGRFKACHIPLIAEYGRFDDVLSLFKTPLESDAIEFIASCLRDGSSLCAKWMPRLRNHSEHAHKIRKHMKLSPKEYRTLLSGLSSTVETKMCAKEWSDIDYKTLPSVASARYMQAFFKHDEDRFSEHMVSGLNTKDLFPHDVARVLHSGKNKSEYMANALWNSMGNDLVDNDQNIIPFIDVSGSMQVQLSGSVTAMDVAVSLGIYLSQRLGGAFKDNFITFTHTPKLASIAGKTFSEAFTAATREIGYGTNIEAAFDLVLDTAVRGNVKVEDMPNKILMLSDMQFNSCGIVDTSFMSMLEQKYEKAGYKIPKLVFWNLCGRSDAVFHAEANDARTTMIGGFSPSTMNFALNDTKVETVEQVVVIDGQEVVQNIDVEVDKTPAEIVQDVIDSERYENISW